MEVNRLLGDELVYELGIRNLPVGNTVEERRNMLREVFRKERLNIAVAPRMVLLDVENEFTICLRKIEELNLAIVNFDHNNRQNDFKRIYSRLLHISLRLARISCQEENSIKVKSDLVARCAQLIGDLNLAYEGLSTSQAEAHGVASAAGDIPHRSLLDQDNPLIPEVVQSQSMAAGVSYDLVDIPAPREEGRPCQRGELLSNEMVPHPPHSSLTNPTQSGGENHRPGIFPTENVDAVVAPHVRFDNVASPVPRSSGPMDRRGYPESVGGHNYVPLDDLIARLEQLHSSPIQSRLPDTEFRPRLPEIGRWNLRYNGRSSVNDFLERVEELRTSRGVTKEQLLRSAPELFTQDALIWYRTGSFESWDVLTSQLKEAFQPHDYEYMLWDEIRRRTQGAQEKVVNFVSVMENLFRKLSQLPSEETRLNLIKRNLLPYIQMQLATHSIDSISELLRLSRIVEETDVRIQRFVPPPSNHRSLLEPELAYRRPSNQPVASVSAIQKIREPFPSTSQTSAAIPITSSIPTVGYSATTPHSLCWNCGASNHRFRACDKPRRKFCFRCGLANVTVASCPHCQKNDRRGHQ